MSISSNTAVKNIIDTTHFNDRLTKIERMRRQSMEISMKSGLMSRQKRKVYIPAEVSAMEFFQGKYDDRELYRCVKKYENEHGSSEPSIEEKFHILYNKDQESLREKGYGNLYFTVGELVWKRTGEHTAYRAPLYFCPADIYKNKRGEYFFTVNRSESRFNPVLRELLLQDFCIDIEEIMDIPSPEEYQQQMERFRYLIGRQKEWFINEETAGLSDYTLPNEAIKNGLSNPKVLNHVLVKGILDGAMEWDNDIEEEKEEGVGIYAYAADSSQEEIIRSASRKRAQVIIGPAGNGKTQTIANYMLEELRTGGKVLFVSEKISVLEVIHDMLKHAGANPFCLKIMDGCQKPEEISRHIADTLVFLEYYEGYAEDDEKDIRKYKEAAAALDSFYGAMNRKGVCGKSMAELIELREKYGKVNVTLNYEQAKEALNEEDCEDIIEMFAKVYKRFGQSGSKYREFFRWDDMNPVQQSEAEEAVDAAIECLENLEICAEKMGQWMGIHMDTLPVKKKIQYMVAYASLLNKCPVVGDKVTELLKQTSEESGEKEKEELLQLLSELRNADTRSRRYKIAAEKLCASIPLTVGERMAILFTKKPDLESLEEKIRTINIRLLKDNAKDSVKRYPDISRINEYKKCLEAAQRLSVGRQEDRVSLENAIEKIGRGNGSKIKILASNVLDSYSAYSRERKRAEQKVLCNVSEFERKYPEEMTVTLFREWKKNHRPQQGIRIYEKAVQRAEAAGLGSFVKQVEEKIAHGYMEAEDIMPAFYKCWCNYNIECIRNENEELQDMSSIDYEILVDNYVKRERKIRRNLRKNMIYRQVSRLPKAKDGIENASEFGRLNSLVRRKNITIRSFFEQTPNALSELYPCMLMSPATVAEYIPSEFPEFDMVIIDEGSQMPTYKALIPISHGKRCMIFGDERQLTPTSFFKKKLNEEDGYLSDVESILSDAIITSMPKKLLKYHYRSESESLIAFSNTHYYANEIVTFPSCSSKISGVEYLYVEDGCYDRGGTKTNFEEACEVVRKVQDIYLELPFHTEETVGIITLNMAQKELIQSLLLKECIENKVLGQKTDELVSVVNLESCQGREWDYVIISPGYGPDKDGSFTVNLGAIGRENGQNRLNVLITRSRKKMFVITSLKPEMLVGDRSTGIRNFREFLEYARGDINYDTRQTVESNDRSSGIMTTVAQKLRKKGYTVHTNIGSSRCKVDIGVCSQRYPDKYMLGILLDHFSDSGYSVKDREIICPETLEKKGWKLYRLHSINWYEDAEQEITEILRRLNEIEDGDDNEQGQ